MTPHVHHSKVESLELGIERTTCIIPGCGYVAYSPRDFDDKKAVQRAEELNNNIGVHLNFKKRWTSDLAVKEKKKMVESKDEIETGGGGDGKPGDESWKETRPLGPLVDSRTPEGKAADAGLPPVPPRPEAQAGLSPRAKMMVSFKYYEANKTAIIDEWEKAGRPKKLERWGISASSLVRILIRWKLMPKPEKKPKTKPEQIPAVAPPKAAAKKPPAAQVLKPGKQEEAPVPEPKPSKTRELPAFPEFNQSWTDEVKVHWLDTYKELAGVGGKQ